MDSNLLSPICTQKCGSKIRDFETQVNQEAATGTKQNPVQQFLSPRVLVHEDLFLERYQL